MEVPDPVGLTAWIYHYLRGLIMNTKNSSAHETNTSRYSRFEQLLRSTGVLYTPCLNQLLWQIFFNSLHLENWGLWHYRLCRSVLLEPWTLIVEGCSIFLFLLYLVKSMQSFKASLDNSLVYFKIQI